MSYNLAGRCRTLVARLPACWALFCLFSAAAEAQNRIIILDFSGSMAGFAAVKGNRLPGTVERLGYILGASIPVEFQGMSHRQSQAPSLQPYNLRQAAMRFGRATSFAGDTPLLWALDQAVTVSKASEILLVTDGMEDGGQIEKVSSALSRLADQKWAIGLLAVSLPFTGSYYTEQTIPISSSFGLIEQEVKKRNPKWNVSKAAAACGDSQCYNFDGERPLLFVAFSRSGSLGPLLQAVRQSLNENRIPPVGLLQLAPASSPTLRVSLDGPKATLARIKLPKSPAEDLYCSEPINELMPLDVKISAVAPMDPPQPSTEVVSSFQLVEPKPNWVAQPPQPLRQDPDGSAAQPIKIMCPKGSVFESVSTLPGRLHIRYQPTCEIKSAGWWVDLSATNSWQFPFKVYKLADLVKEVHQTALKQHKPAVVELNIRMKVQN